MLLNGEIIEIRITEVVGRQPLKPAELKNFKEIVEARASDIVAKWTQFFVENKKIESEIITQRV